MPSAQKIAKEVEGFYRTFLDAFTADCFEACCRLSLLADCYHR